jgi:hypothetical protein
MIGKTPNMKSAMRSRGKSAPKTAREITFAPKESLKRIVVAAGKDLNTARLAHGLIECLLGLDRQLLFASNPAGLLEWSQLPAKLRGDVGSLIDWALSPTRHDLLAFYQASKDIKAGVLKMRQESALGRRFHARAKRLKRLHPPFPQSKWNSLATSFSILPGEVGKPLSERVIGLAKSFKPTTLEILRHDAPMNSGWTAGVLSIRLGKDDYTVDKITFALETPKQLPRNPRRRIEGELFDFFETGCEGVIWMLEDDSRHGREALEMVEEGDHLTIMDQVGIILWQGTIRCNRERGLRPYPMNPEYSQQCALGCWVHWIQDGFEPDEWARFFMRSDSDRLHGVLRKKHGPRQHKPESSRRQDSSA